jgi:hypothetical protein
MSMLAFCEKGGDMPPEERAALAAIFEELYDPLPRKLQQTLRDFDATLSASFESKILPRLKSGAAEASKVSQLDTLLTAYQTYCRRLQSLQPIHLPTQVLYIPVYMPDSTALI